MHVGLVIAPLVIAPLAIEATLVAVRRKRKRAREQGTMAALGVIDLRDSAQVIDLRDQARDESAPRRSPATRSDDTRSSRRD